MRRRHTYLLLAALVAAACSDAAGPEDRVVGGVDLDVLFAPATASEIAAVEADWASRDPAAVDVQVVHDTTVAFDTLDLRIRIVSHDVDGVLHYGAILADADLAEPAPTLVYAHGGDGGVDVGDILTILPFLGEAPAGFVWVIPSFRSEPLELGSRSWLSEGPPSPWDRDVDDALSLLQVAFELEPAADSTRVGVLGFSRGAGVGLLMSARDPGIDRVIEFFGPTDFFDTFVQDVTEEALRGQLRDLPGLDYLNESYIQPLSRGELTVAQVRDQLARRSAVLFADLLAAVQLHHGTADAVVNVSQAYSLIDAMDALGRGEPDFQAYIYEGGTHNPLSLANSIPRAIAFLEALE
ncbi:MAG: hypothetical protein R3253_06130 [Longimicrobiales bacterium]|nr:hypothetical protein [Longimicrobiales bacterium]